MIQTHRLHHRGHRGHGMRLGNPDPRQSFLASFRPTVDEAYSLTREALSSGQITEAKHDAFVQQIDAAEAEAETLLASSAAIETLQPQLDAVERRVVALINTVRSASRASQDAARRRMFFWSVGSVTVGLGVAFAWLAISKRKAV